MHITKFHNPTFTSRNSTIRFADDITRKINKTFPMISSTHIGQLNSIDHFPDFFNRFKCSKIIAMRMYKMAQCKGKENPIDKLIALVNAVTKYKVGNCGESALLAKIIAQLHGIKNCNIANLYTTDGRRFDHSVLYVEDVKKPYIIDAWAGFADYVPNALVKYKNEFSKNFDIKENETLTFVYSAIHKNIGLFGNFTEAELERILQKNLIIY